jgi:glycosyltransferase involved in cell wall biosynthesis
MSEPRFPLVSVLVCVYNGRETICRAIDSVLEQTYPEREIIVVDDGSTDDTLELLRGYGCRIQLVQEKHSGISVARNTGSSAARGEYIAFLDCDDTWIPQKLQFQVETLNKYPSVGLTFGNLEMVDKKGEGLGSTTQGRTDRCSPSWDNLLTGFALYPSSCMLRKELMTKVGGFDPDFSIMSGWEDVEFFLRLREITDFHYLDVCLGCYYFDEAKTLRYLSNLLLYARKQWNNPRLQTQANDRFRNDFVAFCASNLSHYVRLQLKLERNEVSKEMLNRLNEFHDSFKGLFGNSYKQVTGLDSIDLNKYELFPASSVLLFLYLTRSDLQLAFPEVRTGDLQRLIKWGADATRENSRDFDRPILLTYHDELEPKSTALSNLRRLWSHARRHIENH